jgi:hypothetical protein
LFKVGFGHLRFNARFEEFIDGRFLFDFDGCVCRQGGDGAIGCDLGSGMINFGSWFIILATKELKQGLSSEWEG